VLEFHAKCQSNESSQIKMTSKDSRSTASTQFSSSVKAQTAKLSPYAFTPKLLRSPSYGGGLPKPGNRRLMTAHVKKMSEGEIQSRSPPQSSRGSPFIAKALELRARPFVLPGNRRTGSAADLHPRLVIRKSATGVNSPKM
jgi:hypothetical protein